MYIEGGWVGAILVSFAIPSSLATKPGTFKKQNWGKQGYTLFLLFFAHNNKLWALDVLNKIKKEYHNFSTENCYFHSLENQFNVLYALRQISFT